VRKIGPARCRSGLPSAMAWRWIRSSRRCIQRPLRIAAGSIKNPQLTLQNIMTGIARIAKSGRLHEFFFRQLCAEHVRSRSWPPLVHQIVTDKV
jgi:hypothetical protein